MRKLFLVLLLIFSEMVCAKAKTKTDNSVSNEEQIIDKVQDFFRKLTTLEAVFVQIDKHGNAQSGRLWIKRPNLMKMSYQDRVIIVKDNRVINYDKELKEKTETAIYSSPLLFILEWQIDLRKNLKVLSVLEGDDFISVKFCKKNDEEEGAVVLVFSKNPMELRKWIVFNSKNDETAGIEVALFDWKYGKNIPDSEFNRLVDF